MDINLAPAAAPEPPQNSCTGLTPAPEARSKRMGTLLAGRRESLPGSVHAAVEQERERIAKELHAGAGQPLSGMQVNLEIVEEYLRAPDSRDKVHAEEAMRRLRHLIAEAVGQVRAVSHRLHPPEWQRLPLGEALRRLIDFSGLAQKVRVEVRIEGLPPKVSHQTKVALYRSAQECIANIIRHSQATFVQFEVAADVAFIRLSIADNGRGFHPVVSGDGLGLRAMLKHAETLGGRCTIHSGEQGSRIDIRVPLDPELPTSEPARG